MIVADLAHSLCDCYLFCQVLRYAAEEQKLPEIVMPRLQTREESTLSDECLEVFKPLRISGKLPEVYLQFANSEPAVMAYLGMEKSLQQVSLSALEIEAIKLFVSQITQCEYCLSVHTMKAKKAGMDEEFQMAVRSNRPTNNAKVDALLAIVNAFFKTPGVLDDKLLDDARSAGITDEQLVATAMVVSTIFFTNITNHINNSVSVLAPAPVVS